MTGDVLRLAPEAPPITGMRVTFDVAFSEITTPPFYPKNIHEARDWGVAVLIFPTFKQRLLRGFVARVLMMVLARQSIKGTDIEITALPAPEDDDDEL